MEAIMLLATGKSFRADVEREMIREGGEIGRVEGFLADNTKLEVVVTGGSVLGKKTPYKQYKVNNVGKRSIDFVGNLPAVLFWPEDLRLITGSPSRRRQYLNNVLVQTEKPYRYALKQYEKALRVRNRLLQHQLNGLNIKQDEMDYWEKQLIQNGTTITSARAGYLDFMNKKNNVIDGITYRIVYDRSILSSERLSQYRDVERRTGMTVVGPHRDDFIVERIERRKNHADISKFGSRGEQRLAVLWLKMAERSYLEEQLGIKPLLLLDDIFSELDEKHRSFVMSLVSKQQTILATVDRATLPKEKAKKAQIIPLSEE